MFKTLAFTAILLLGLSMQTATANELGEDGFADSDGVKIHYVTAGKGPLVVLIHGFPDFWYSWREQIPELAKNFQVVAIDQRGYNKSDKPEGVENYAMPKLVADVDAVVKHFKAEKAIIVEEITLTFAYVDAPAQPAPAVAAAPATAEQAPSPPTELPRDPLKVAASA